MQVQVLLRLVLLQAVSELLQVGQVLPWVREEAQVPMLVWMSQVYAGLLQRGLSLSNPLQIKQIEDAERD